MNEILRRLDDISEDWSTIGRDAAVFIRAQNTKLENAEMAMRAARQILSMVWLDETPPNDTTIHAAIILIDACLKETP